MKQTFMDAWSLAGTRPLRPLRHYLSNDSKASYCGLCPAPLLDFNLLRDLKRVIDLDPEVANSALQLGMAEQELDGS